ncbi:MAG: hypothetical protein IPM49_12235 [Flavobacteriales bacterium]|nr:hypothetical protein [Flavobacteriales bacterium]
MNMQIDATAPELLWYSKHRPFLVVEQLFFHLTGNPTASQWSNRLASSSLVVNCTLVDLHQPDRPQGSTGPPVSLNALITPAMKQPWLPLGNHWRFDPPVLRPEDRIGSPQWEVRLWLKDFSWQPEESVVISLETDAELVKPVPA